MGIYISKNGYSYPMYNLSDLASHTQKTINSVVNVLKSYKEAKVRGEDRTLFSRWAKDTEGLLLFIERNSEGKVTYRFAVDLTK